MAKKSAGILLYRFREAKLQVFLVHPGGPFWKKKDDGAWSIPKGEFEEEDPLTAAKREFREETGFTVMGKFLPLLPIRQKSGKIVTAFAIEGDCDASSIQSNLIEIEWPPKSGTKKSIPEVDRADWFFIGDAKIKILPSQVMLLNELAIITGIEV